MNIWRYIDQMLGPPLCQLCGAEGIGPEICAGCYRDLPRARSVCPLCARPVPVEGVCPACSLRRPLYDRARVPFIYDFPVNRLIRRLKYGGARSHGRLLGELTGSYFELRSVQQRLEIARRTVEAEQGTVDVIAEQSAAARAAGPTCDDDACDI